jgi:hypothetical protein
MFSVVSGGLGIPSVGVLVGSGAMVAEADAVAVPVAVTVAMAVAVAVAVALIDGVDVGTCVRVFLGVCVGGLEVWLGRKGTLVGVVLFLNCPGLRSAYNTVHITIPTSIMTLSCEQVMPKILLPCFLVSVNI